MLLHSIQIKLLLAFVFKNSLLEKIDFHSTLPVKLMDTL